MITRTHSLLLSVMFVASLAGAAPAASPASEAPSAERNAVSSGGTGKLVVFGDPNPRNPAWQNALMERSLQQVADAFKALPATAFDIDLIPTRQLTRGLIQERLAQYSRSLATNDTFVIYSHSHGNAVGTYFASWPDLADAILKIPARNVVVLTMSCHSGYLAEALQAKRNLWEGRTNSGRNLIVLTSVSPEQSSGPSPEPGIGNPFTYAVTTAIQGAADGFSGRPKDGRIEMQEFVDYILKTANEHSRGQVHQPQAAGEYLPHAVLFPANLATPPGRIERFHLDGEHWTCIADGKPIGGLLFKPGGDSQPRLGRKCRRHHGRHGPAVRPVGLHRHRHQLHSCRKARPRAVRPDAHGLHADRCSPRKYSACPGLPGNPAPAKRR